MFYPRSFAFAIQHRSWLVQSRLFTCSCRRLGVLSVRSRRKRLFGCNCSPKCLSRSFASFTSSKERFRVLTPATFPKIDAVIEKDHIVEFEQRKLGKYLQSHRMIRRAIRRHDFFSKPKTYEPNCIWSANSPLSNKVNTEVAGTLHRNKTAPPPHSAIKMSAPSQYLRDLLSVCSLLFLFHLSLFFTHRIFFAQHTNR